jgi:hypothetical protein
MGAESGAIGTIVLGIMGIGVLLGAAMLAALHAAVYAAYMFPLAVRRVEGDKAKATFVVLMSFWVGFAGLALGAAMAALGRGDHDAITAGVLIAAGVISVATAVGMYRATGEHALAAAPLVGMLGATAACLLGLWVLTFVAWHVGTLAVTVVWRVMRRR